MFFLEDVIIDKQRQIQVSDANGQFSARINLTLGCSLQEFMVDGVPIIKEIPSFPYPKSYASSLLFPFVSRTQKGQFTFEGKSYQLEKNEPGGENALHGLIYNKEFEFLSSEQSDEKIRLSFCYKEVNPPEGFPFNYVVFVDYIFTSSTVVVEMKVVNQSEGSFPFTIGWHPYFSMPKPEKSYLEFRSSKGVLFDEHLITKEIIDQQSPSRIPLKDKFFDDCFVLEDNQAVFKTESYQLHLTTNKKENFLQVYTPPNLPLIAIEPMVGLSNSLNNGIGLQILKPKESYEIQWRVAVKTINE